MSAPADPSVAAQSWKRSRVAAAAPASGTPAAFVLVVDALLHAGGVYVFRGRDDNGLVVRCVARLSDMRTPAPGEVWEVRGEWQRHPDHGAQVGVVSAALQQPSGRLFVQAVAKNTSAFPGIGVARAQAVWDAHCAGVFDLLDKGDPAPFSTQLGDDLAGVLVAGWRAIGDEARAYRWLTRYGFPPRLAAKVVAIYSEVPVPVEARDAAANKGRIVWHLEDDPYRMLAFATWRQTDAAAGRLGLDPMDDRRLVGAVESVCASRLAEGSTWVAGDDVRSSVARLLDCSRAIADRAVAEAVARRVVVEHADGYQPPGAWAMERFVSQRCAEMAAGRFVPSQRSFEVSMDRSDVDGVIEQSARAQGFRLTDEQRDGVWMAVTQPISVMTGGPGVGKTTVMRAVHEVCDAAHRVVHQAALSGRAAQRLAEATGRPASTIAALLMRLEKGEVNMLYEPLLILDECSMIDLGTLYRLLARLPVGVRVLLVGDPGQLAPVGFGLTFHALVHDRLIPRTELTLPQRQTNASGIPAVCDAIRRGVVPTLTAPDWEGGGVGFISASPGRVTDTVIEVLAALGSAAQAQVVGSVKRRPGGVDEINRILQGLRGVGRTQLNGRFYIGDPVVATVNDYDLQVMNGEL